MPVLDLPHSDETQLLTSEINVEQVITSGHSKTFSYEKGYSPGINVLRGINGSHSSYFSQNLLIDVCETDFLLSKQGNWITLPKGNQSSFIGFEKKSLPRLFKKNLKTLKDAFENELSRREEVISISKDKAREVFNSVSSYIAELPFEDSAVELIDRSSLKFTLLFSGNKILMVKKMFAPSEVELGESDVFFSLFVNRKLVTSDVSEITAFSKGFQKYLKM